MGRAVLVNPWRAIPAQPGLFDSSKFVHKILSNMIYLHKLIHVHLGPRHDIIIFYIKMLGLIYFFSCVGNTKMGPTCGAYLENCTEKRRNPNLQEEKKKKQPT